ncbi:MAG: alpha/beta hydrolase [Pirellulaceae bacterium]
MVNVGRRLSNIVRCYPVYSVIAVVIMLPLCFFIICTVRGDARKEIAVIPLAGTDNLNRIGDVVFIHGLGADAQTNWGTPDAEYYWPTSVHDQFGDAGVWLLDYDAYRSEWDGRAMSISDRAENLLDQMHLNGLGDRPIVFVCHSLGGVIAIQMMEKGATLSRREFREIFSQTKGIAFLSSPLSGSDHASYLNKISAVHRSTPLIEDLRRDSSVLRRLMTWFKDNSQRNEIAVLALVEKKPTSGLGIIVTESSGDPRISGVFPIPVDEDHLSICRPRSDRSHVSLAVSRFIKENLKPNAIPVDVSISDFLGEYRLVHNDPAGLDKLREKYEGKKFTWDAFVLDVKPPVPATRENEEVKAAYVISDKRDARGADRIYASFAQYESGWSIETRIGSRVRVSGVFDRVGTSSLAAVLKESIHVVTLNMSDGS